MTNRSIGAADHVNLLIDLDRWCCWSIRILGFAAAVLLLLLQSAWTDRTPQFHCWTPVVGLLIDPLLLLLINPLLLLLLLLLSIRQNMKTMTKIDQSIDPDHSTAAVSKAKRRTIGVLPLLRTESTTSITAWL